MWRTNVQQLFFVVVMMLVSATSLQSQSPRPAGSQRTDQTLACSVEPLHTPMPDLWTPRTGEFRAQFVVRRSGEVTDIDVLRSTYTPEQTESAMTVLRTWKFEPATKNGQAVSVRMNVGLRFTRASANIALQFVWPKGHRGCVPFPMPTM